MPKDIVSGAIITVAIFALSVFMPVVGFFSAMFIPLPMAVYRIKLGRNAGLIMAAAAMAGILAILGSVSVDALAFFELLLLGFVLGELFERDLTVERTVLVACGVVMLVAIGIVLFISAISSTPAGTMISAYVARNLEQTLAMYKAMGVSEEVVQTLVASMDRIQYVLVRILPGLLTMSVLFVTWANLLMARSVLQSRGMTSPSFGQLDRWKAPEVLVWGVIGCGAMVILAPGSLKLVGMNGLLVLLTVYFFQGIAIVSFYFEKKNFPRLLRILLYSFIALQQLAVLVVIGLGLFDIWLNFRKLEKTEDPGAPD